MAEQLFRLISLRPSQIEVISLGVLVAVACALVGTFLVLRRMSMMGDAISHTVFFGIILAFLIVHDVHSPWLMVGAVAIGVFTVWLVEVLIQSRRVREDAAIGLVFPFLFSLGVIMVSMFAKNAHIGIHVVLLGEPALAPFNRYEFFGIDLPRSVWVMGSILLVNLLFISLFYKELKLATFDMGLAVALGFSPALIHYGLMTLVSLTAVGAFDAVGAILVIAFLVGPPAAAYLLTDRLSVMIGISMAIGALSAVSGYFMARTLDSTISGSMAFMVGVWFTLVFMVAPERGVLAVLRRRRRQKWEFAQQVLAVHLFNHPPEAREERHINHMHHHLRWGPDFAQAVLRRARRRGLIVLAHDYLELTPRGQQFAQQSIMNVGAEA
jgi:manganese/zinc/iron transport system permease protein